MSSDMQSIPEWVQPALPVTDADKERLANVRRSWSSLNKAFKTLSEVDMLKILMIEIETAQRPIIIGRVLARFRTMRSVRETGQLYTMIPAGVADAVSKHP